MAKKKVAKNSKVEGRLEGRGVGDQLKELKLAQGRVGSRPVDRLRWLLTFAYRDLATISQGQLTDLAWEVVSFAVPANLQSLSRVQVEQAQDDLFSLTHPGGPSEALRKILSKPSDHPIRELTQDEISLLQESPKYGDELVPGNVLPKASDRLVRKFQMLLGQGFDDFFYSMTGWKISRPPTEESLIYNAGEIMTRGSNPPSPEIRLINLAFDLVKAEGERLILCNNPKCRRRFVSARKDRAMYCSPRCSAYVRVNKARGKTEKLKEG